MDRKRQAAQHAAAFEYRVLYVPAKHAASGLVGIAAIYNLRAPSPKTTQNKPRKAARARRSR